MEGNLRESPEACGPASLAHSLNKVGEKDPPCMCLCSHTQTFMCTWTYTHTQHMHTFKNRKLSGPRVFFSFQRGKKKGVKEKTKEGGREKRRVGGGPKTLECAFGFCQSLVQTHNKPQCLLIIACAFNYILELCKQARQKSPRGSFTRDHPLTRECISIGICEWLYVKMATHSQG